MGRRECREAEPSCRGSGGNPQKTIRGWAGGRTRLATHGVPRPVFIFLGARRPVPSIPRSPSDSRHPVSPAVDEESKSSLRDHPPRPPLMPRDRLAATPSHPQAKASPTRGIMHSNCTPHFERASLIPFNGRTPRTLEMLARLLHFSTTSPICNDDISPAQDTPLRETYSNVVISLHRTRHKEILATITLAHQPMSVLAFVPRLVGPSTARGISRCRPPA